MQASSCLEETLSVEIQIGLSGLGIADYTEEYIQIVFLENDMAMYLKQIRKKLKK